MYAFDIFITDTYQPSCTVLSYDRDEFLALLKFVQHVRGTLARMWLETESITLSSDEDWDNNEGWYVHYALAVLEGEIEEVEA